MASSLFVSFMQVNFESVLTMEHSGMAKMFKSLEVSRLKGFLEASNSVYESVVIEFFANAKVIAGTIVSLAGTRKMALTKDKFTEAFGLPYEGLTNFLNIPKETVSEMRHQLSGSDEPFQAPNKKREMKTEFHLLHDVVTKALCAKAGSFDQVTSAKLNMMIAISAGLKFNWAQILFQVLLNMVNFPKCQSQGFSIQISVLLRNIVKENLGESEKLHPQKVLTGKSVQTYIKKNLEIKPSGESSKQNEDTSSNTEGGVSQGAQPVKKEKIVNKKKMITEEEPRQKKPKGSKRTKRVESSDSESNISLPITHLVRRKRTQRPQTLQRSTGERDDPQHGSIPTVPVEGAGISVKENIATGSKEHERANHEPDAQMGGGFQNEENQGYETRMDPVNPNESDGAQNESERSTVNILEKKLKTLNGLLSSALAEQEQAVDHASIQPTVQHDSEAVKSQDHQAHEHEPSVQEVEHQALDDDHQAHCEHNSLDEQQEQQGSGGNPTQIEDPSVHIVDISNNPGTHSFLDEHGTDHQDPSPSNLRMVTYTPHSEEDTWLSFLKISESSHAGSQWMFISSPPDSPQANSKLDEAEKVVASIDSRMIYMEPKLTSVDSRTLSLDSKMQSMEFNFRSLNSHIERLLDTQTFLKLDFGRHKGIIYEKVDTLTSTVKSSKTTLETSLILQFAGQQQQFIEYVDMVKLKLAELVEHLKKIGNDKKGEGGQSRSKEGLNRSGE
ncbi:hypothetical protein F511_44558 [Dorcoceras hygrometricum]|uniref:Delphilin-like n=1 Tax=Dorcoceras hygrometricum TaxID=472368 RepID=A0A2Z6ZXL4_9LAMI|nr:hypothetical protein F511_44558 [Dorcoceras hygrometricum]